MSLEKKEENDEFAKIAMRIKNSCVFPSMIETSEDKKHVENLLKHAVSAFSTKWKIDYESFSHTCIVPCDEKRYNFLIQEQEKQLVEFVNIQIGTTRWNWNLLSRDTLRKLALVQEETQVAFTADDFFGFSKNEENGVTNIIVNKSMYFSEFLSDTTIEEFDKMDSLYYEKVTKTLYKGHVSLPDIGVPVFIEVGGKMSRYLNKGLVFGHQLVCFETVGQLKEALEFEITNPARVLDRQLTFAGARFRPDIYV